MKHTIALLITLACVGCNHPNNGNNYEGGGYHQQIPNNTEFEYQPPQPKPKYRPYRNPFDVHFKAKGWQTY